jgi:hypothetical protein
MKLREINPLFTARTSLLYFVNSHNYKVTLNDSTLQEGVFYMKIEYTTIFGFTAALRGMRNPQDSWVRADTTYDYDKGKEPQMLGFRIPECPVVGPNDLALMCTLTKAGGDHRKFLRYIVVTADLTLPRDQWQELDTYKVATVRNSCSTMNKLGSRALTKEDFEKGMIRPVILREVNMLCEIYRAKGEFQDEDGARYRGNALLELLKHNLPEGYLQKATYEFNYENALKMYVSRKDHRMSFWSGTAGLCAWIRSWPYMPELIASLGV